MSQQDPQGGYDSRLFGMYEQRDVAAAIAASSSETSWAPQSPTERETVRRQMEAYSKARNDQQDAEANKAVNETGTESPKTKLSIPPPLLKERINDMAARLDHGLPKFCDHNGDTYVFIDPPTQQFGLGDAGYSSYIERYNEPFVIQARVLLKLRSPFFERLFSPRYQFRVIRRRGLVGNLPTGIKYVLDLTPPTEGEEAVYLTTQLCCSEGVIKWSKSNRRWGVSKSLVGGLEEYTPLQPFPDHQSGSSPPIQIPGSLQPTNNQEQSMPLEYTPLRHRAAIERVLSAVQGQNPQIDSAPKLWTTYAIAKYFEITHSPLTDYIVRWLRAYPNSYFIEVLPEVSLKIADGLECQQLCRDAFSILVGEAALGDTCRCRGGALRVGYSVHGRKQDDLPEVYKTRIEYASKALLDRVAAIFQNLVGAEMSWLEQLPEFNKIRFNDQPNVITSSTSTTFKIRLKAFVRGAIYKLLCSKFFPLPSAKDVMHSDNDLYPTTTWMEICNCLLPRERIMTRAFWRILSNQDFVSRKSNFDIKSLTIISAPCPDPEPTAAEESMLRAGVFEEVLMADIVELGLVLNLEALSHADIVPRSDSQYSPSELAGAAVTGSGQNVTMLGDDNNIDRFKTANPVLIPAPTFVPQLNEVSITTGFQTRAKEREVINNSILASIAHNTASRFKVGILLDQVQNYIQSLCARMLRSDDTHTPLELELTDTLVCLEDTEWKYLPIWANGNDDGSGGVYNDEIPLADGGFSTAGPHVRTSTASSMASSDSYEVISSRPSGITQNTSTIVEDGRSSALFSMRSCAMSEGGESWTNVRTGRNNDGAGLRARFDNCPSADTRSMISASNDGMVIAHDGNDVDEEAKLKGEVCRMEHMKEKTGEAVMTSADRDFEDDIANAFLNDDDDNNAFVEDDDDSSATELGDPSDTGFIDEDMKDEEELEGEDEDTIVV